MNTYSVSQFAALVGVSANTLQRWDWTGKLVALRTPSNRRLYTDEHLTSIRGWRQPTERKVVVYCRVSSQAQQPDLANQRQELEQFCAANHSPMVSVCRWLWSRN